MCVNCLSASILPHHDDVQLHWYVAPTCRESKVAAQVALSYAARRNVLRAADLAAVQISLILSPALNAASAVSLTHMVSALTSELARALSAPRARYFFMVSPSSRIGDVSILGVRDHLSHIFHHKNHRDKGERGEVDCNLKTRNTNHILQCCGGTNLWCQLWLSSSCCSTLHSDSGQNITPQFSLQFLAGLLAL